MLGRLAPCLLALLLLVPAASAFSARHDPIELAYDAQHAPVVIAAGQERLEGAMRDAVLVAGAAPWTAKAVPTLTVDEKGGLAPLPAQSSFASATLRVESGTLIWRLGDGSAALDVQADAAYGLALAMDQVPVPLDNGSQAGAGALLVGPQVDAQAHWPGGETQVLVLDGVVTILRADGEPEPGWSHRAVNANATSPDAAGSASLIFRTAGAFDSTSTSTLFAGAAGSAANLSLSVKAADQDRFTDTVQVLSDLGSQIGMDDKKGSPFGADSPLSNLAPFSGVLNGALLVINAGNDTQTPLDARMGADSFDPGPISLMRSGDMGIAWSGTQMRIQGSPAVAVTRAGFAVDSAASIAGIVPIVSVVLWLGAIGAIVFFFVKRPEKVKPKLAVRLLSWLGWLVALVIVFLVWDASFAATFGTSALTLLRHGGLDPARLGAVFALEMVPWSFASLLFALPLRIIAGVLFRVFLPGKPLKNAAKGVGLLGLAVLGPIYALWIVNVGIQQAVAALAH
jgi:hypothetical protein